MDIWIMSKFLWFWVSLRFNSHTTTFTHSVYSSLYDHGCNLWSFSSTCKEFLYILVFPAYHLSLHIYVLLNPTLYSTYIWTCTICHYESLVSFPERPLRVLPCCSSISQKCSLFFNKQLVKRLDYCFIKHLVEF